MGVMIGYIYSFTFGVFLKDVMNMSVTIRSKNENVFHTNIWEKEHDHIWILKIFSFTGNIVDWQIHLYISGHLCPFPMSKKQFCS